MPISREYSFDNADFDEREYYVNFDDIAIDRSQDNILYVAGPSVYIGTSVIQPYGKGEGKTEEDYKNFWSSLDLRVGGYKPGPICLFSCCKRFFKITMGTRHGFGFTSIHTNDNPNGDTVSAFGLGLECFVSAGISFGCVCADNIRFGARLDSGFFGNWDLSSYGLRTYLAVSFFGASEFSIQFGRLYLAVRRYGAGFLTFPLTSKTSAFGYHIFVVTML